MGKLWLLLQQTPLAPPGYKETIQNRLENSKTMGQIWHLVMLHLHYQKQLLELQMLHPNSLSSLHVWYIIVLFKKCKNAWNFIWRYNGSSTRGCKCTFIIPTSQKSITRSMNRNKQRIIQTHNYLPTTLIRQ